MWFLILPCAAALVMDKKTSALGVEVTGSNLATLTTN